MIKKKQRVIVGMSGGVDSSVAALLLKQQGFDVIGVMLKLWAEEGFNRENQCCSIEAANQAHRIATKIDIPFYLLDAVEPFYKAVVQPFISSYLSGETPNPCAWCNPLVRWKQLLLYADAMNADYVATGHYVRTIKDAEGFVHLFRGMDSQKDQSYVISRLSQDQLQRSIFPVGDYFKSQVRKISAEYHLPYSEKPESQDICFIGDGNYRRFLKQMQPQRISSGKFIDSEGKEIGQHDGIPFYTIGQRKGLKISAKNPLYVIEKDVIRNEIVLGQKEDLRVKKVVAGDINWICNEQTVDSFDCFAQFRYKSKAVPVSVRITEEKRMIISLKDDFFDGVACGQIAVLYDTEGEVIGSGRILKTERK